MEKIIIRMSKLFLCLLGGFLSGFLIYNRFIREREPRPLPEALSASQLCLYISLFSISILVFTLILVRLLLTNKEAEAENNLSEEIFKQPKIFFWLKTKVIWVKNLPEKFGLLLKKSFREFHAFIVSLIPNYILAHLAISRFLSYLEFGERILLVVMFVFLPQILVSIGFAIDVFYVHQWHNFYKIIICLGYPMIFNAYIGILNQLYDENFEIVKEYLHETVDVATKKCIVDFNGTQEDLANFGVTDLMDFIDTYFCGFRDMKPTVMFFEEVKAYFGPWILLLTSLIYSSGWLYVILHGLHVISY